MSISVTLAPVNTEVSVSSANDIAVSLTNPTTTVEVNNQAISLPQSLGTTDSPTFAGLTVNGGITSNSFTYSRAVALQDGNLSASQYLALAGKRIIQSGSTNPTYTLFQPVAADVGKSWIICNPSTANITIDPDTQNVWILDGVTLSARESSWFIKKGGVAEIVCIASHATGGGVSMPNFIIFGAGIIEL